MQTQRILDQEELASIIAAAFSYNRMRAVDVAFDIREGLKAIVTCEEEPLSVRESPETVSAMDSMSEEMLRRMHERSKLAGGRG